MSADFSPNGHFPDAPDEAHDPVWRLLARAPLAEPDGWFAARTLARCRLGSADPASPRWAWQKIWHWALGAGLGVCLAVFAVTRIQHETVLAEHQKHVQEAFEIVASMGDDSSDNSTSTTPASWPDSSF